MAMMTLTFMPGERMTEMLLLRPTWGKHVDFSADRNRLLEEKRDKIRELKEEYQTTDEEEKCILFS